MSSTIQACGLAMMPLRDRKFVGKVSHEERSQIEDDVESLLKIEEKHPFLLAIPTGICFACLQAEKVFCSQESAFPAVVNYSSSS